YSIELIPDQTFGDSGEPYLRNLYLQSVDDKGRVLITEQAGMDTPLHVYNPDGSYLTQVGRSGRGPGDYGLISIASVRAGKLFVYDLGNLRLNIYDSKTYEFERSVRREDWSVLDHEAVQNMRLSVLYTRDDGNHIAHFYNQSNEIFPELTVTDSVRQTYILVNSDGDVLNPEPLVIPHRYFLSRERQTSDGGSHRLPLAAPFLGGGSIFALAGDGTMYIAWLDDFLIKKYDDQWRYQSAFYYPVKGPPFDFDSFEGFRGYSPREIRQALQASDLEIPDSYPVLREIKADDEDRIWARVRVESDDKDAWWVLDDSGRLLARFLWPRREPIHEIKDGYLYSRILSSEDETGKVIRHRIELTER
ncbi:MAG: 6-bladed beta-propeller, partial [Balneolaceae bacterium]